jgi:ribosome-binding factor A
VKRGQGRPRKIGDLIQRELSDLLYRELRDPRVGMLTITSVDVSPDMSHAKVFFTILDKENLRETTETLQRAAGFLRSRLAKRVTLYSMPELRFQYDESIARADRLSRLIDSVRPKK